MLTRFVKAVFGFTIGLVSLSTQPAAAEGREELTWGEASSTLVGKHIRIVMPDGSVLEGTATAFNAETLVLDVRKTNGAANYSKGNLSVPRTSMKTLQVADSTIRWRVAGVAAGSVLGVVAIALGVGAASDKALLGGSKEPARGTAASLFGAAVALPVGGYFLGKKADRHWTTVVIVP